MSRRDRTRWAGQLGAYAPGSTWLHRLAPGWKLLGLLGLSVLLMVWRQPAVVLTALVGGLALLALTGTPLRPTARQLGPVIVVTLVLGAFQWWSRDLHTAVVVAGTILALVIAATVVTASTRSDQLLDALIRAAGPLRRTGLSPEVLAMTIALMLRTIPTLVDLAWDVRDAARARGLDRSPRAHLVPFAVRAVSGAHRTADALAARGILDDEPPESLPAQPLSGPSRST